MTEADLTPVRFGRYYLEDRLAVGREKLFSAFRMQSGEYCFYRGKLCQHEAAPLGLDAFEVIAAGLFAQPDAYVQGRLERARERRVRAVSQPVVPPEVFRMGSLPREVFDKLDGRHSADELLARFDVPEQRRMFAGMLLLLLEAGLAELV